MKKRKLPVCVSMSPENIAWLKKEARKRTKSEGTKITVSRIIEDTVSSMR